MDSAQSMTADYPDQLWRPLTQHAALRGATPPQMQSAKGCTLTMNNGAQLLDGLAGLWCVNIGYGRREIGEIAARQMEQLNYLAPVMACEPTLALAEKMKKMLGFKCHSYFSSSGSEANEAAFKIARQYHLQNGKPGDNRYKIISRYRAYHGNTAGAMAATGQAERKTGSEPGPAGFVHVMPPYPFRAHPKLSTLEHGAECARLLEEAIIHEGANTVAAVIMEPMMSGGGVIVPPDNYLPLVRQICDRYGVLLIFDEVVSGFGRLGTMFGYEHWATEADIYTFAKGLSSGYFPMGATVVKDHVFTGFDGASDSMRHLRQINTFGGHPVGAAIALEAIAIVEREGLAGNAREQGDHVRDVLGRELGQHPHVGEIRGLGMLTGIELVEDRESKVPLGEAKIMQILASCMGDGVILGRNTNTVPGRCNILLIAPPLVVTRDEIDRIAAAVTKALKSVA